jgi:hypothetical protein
MFQSVKLALGYIIRVQRGLRPAVSSTKPGVDRGSKRPFTNITACKPSIHIKSEVALNESWRQQHTVMRVFGDRASCKMVWECKDASVARFLPDTDVSELRAVSKDWRDAVDATLTRLRPVSLRCPHLSSRYYCCTSTAACLCCWRHNSVSKRTNFTSSSFIDRFHSQFCRRLLPGLKSLLLDHPKLTLLQPQHLQECGSLTQLTQLQLGGQACFSLRAQHLSWISSLTRLQDLQLRGCTKVGAATAALAATPELVGVD